jgi:hypothetical protein
MFCKTYSGDLGCAKRMLMSFHIHNKDSIKMYMSVPEREIELFHEFTNENVTLISDESYAKKYFSTTTKHGFSIGYFNHEVCKLAFWETGLAQNYLCVDSDLIFIRDFYIVDFMADKQTPIHSFGYGQGSFYRKMVS